MRCRRALLVAILVYVALDLSLPTLPGAFEFEPADSVDGIGGGRAAALIVALAPGSPLIVLPPRRDLRRPRPRRCEVAPGGCPVTQRLVRDTGDVARPSEDPH
jgi:hypothetical protein